MFQMKYNLFKVRISPSNQILRVESVQTRAADIPDSIAHGVKEVVGAMPLPESQEGCKLVIDIVGAEQDA